MDSKEDEMAWLIIEESVAMTSEEIQRYVTACSRPMLSFIHKKIGKFNKTKREAYMPLYRATRKEELSRFLKEREVNARPASNASCGNAENTIAGEEIENNRSRNSSGDSRLHDPLYKQTLHAMLVSGYYDKNTDWFCASLALAMDETRRSDVLSHLGYDDTLENHTSISKYLESLRVRRCQGRTTFSKEYFAVFGQEPDLPMEEQSESDCSPCSPTTSGGHLQPGTQVFLLMPHPESLSQHTLYKVGIGVTSCEDPLSCTCGETVRVYIKEKFLDPFQEGNKVCIVGFTPTTPPSDQPLEKQYYMWPRSMTVEKPKPLEQVKNEAFQAISQAAIENRRIVNSMKPFRRGRNVTSQRLEELEQVATAKRQQYGLPNDAPVRPTTGKNCMNDSELIVAKWYNGLISSANGNKNTEGKSSQDKAIILLNQQVKGILGYKEDFFWLREDYKSTGLDKENQDNNNEDQHLQSKQSKLKRKRAEESSQPMPVVEPRVSSSGRHIKPRYGAEYYLTSIK